VQLVVVADSRSHRSSRPETSRRPELSMPEERPTSSARKRVAIIGAGLRWSVRCKVCGRCRSSPSCQVQDVLGGKVWTPAATSQLVTSLPGVRARCPSFVESSGVHPAASGGGASFPSRWLAFGLASPLAAARGYQSAHYAAAFPHASICVESRTYLNSRVYCSSSAATYGLHTLDCT
jgi:hypothetical protein